MIHLIIPIIISVYGDSTILGYEVINGKATITKNNPPAVLQLLYGDTAKVSAEARVGATLKDLINGTGWFKTPFEKAIKSDPGNIIIENFAINDSHLYSAIDYENYLNKFISIVRDANKIPVLEEPNPICASPAWSKQLDGLNAIIDKVANEKDVLVVKQYDYIKSISNWPLLTGDCIHPYDYLYAIKARNEYIALSTIL